MEGSYEYFWTFTFSSFPQYSFPIFPVLLNDALKLITDTIYHLL
jgi:hypothetical protein